MVGTEVTDVCLVSVPAESVGRVPERKQMLLAEGESGGSIAFCGEGRLYQRKASHLADPSSHYHNPVLFQQSSVCCPHTRLGWFSDLTDCSVCCSFICCLT